MKRQIWKICEKGVVKSHFVFVTSAVGRIVAGAELNKAITAK